ncbi:hypothetical protein FDECE_17363 [Fusarium decemcellulare]|nr:hypothetical protein FDECE_17363 [Fusarium decemcellulare]
MNNPGGNQTPDDEWIDLLQRFAEHGPGNQHAGPSQPPVGNLLPASQDTEEQQQNVHESTHDGLLPLESDADAASHSEASSGSSTAVEDPEHQDDSHDSDSDLNVFEGNIDYLSQWQEAESSGGSASDRIIEQVMNRLNPVMRRYAAFVSGEIDAAMVDAGLRPRNRTPETPAPEELDLMDLIESDDEQPVNNGSGEIAANVGPGSVTPVSTNSDTSIPAAGSGVNVTPAVPNVEQAESFTDTEDSEATCVACGSKDELIHCQCGHFFCPNCLVLLVEGCLDMDDYPPQCCSQNVPVDANSGHFSGDVLAKFLVRKAEHESPNPVYCFDELCGDFIPPQDIDGNQAICRGCHNKCQRLIVRMSLSMNLLQGQLHSLAKSPTAPARARAPASPMINLMEREVRRPVTSAETLSGAMVATCARPVATSLARRGQESPRGGAALATESSYMMMKRDLAEDGTCICTCSRCDQGWKNCRCVSDIERKRWKHEMLKADIKAADAAIEQTRFSGPDGGPAAIEDLPQELPAHIAQHPLVREERAARQPSPSTDDNNGNPPSLLGQLLNAGPEPYDSDGDNLPSQMAFSPSLRDEITSHMTRQSDFTHGGYVQEQLERLGRNRHSGQISGEQPPHVALHPTILDGLASESANTGSATQSAGTIGQNLINANESLRRVFDFILAGALHSPPEENAEEEEPAEQEEPACTHPQGFHTHQRDGNCSTCDQQIYNFVLACTVCGRELCYSCFRGIFEETMTTGDML